MKKQEIRSRKAGSLPVFLFASERKNSSDKILLCIKRAIQTSNYSSEQVKKIILCFSGKKLKKFHLK